MIKLAIFVVVLGARTAAADDSRADARRHVDRATAFHKDGKFAEALAELETAYTLEPRPQLLFAMGQIHARLGRCREAITFYQRFLASSPSPGPAAIATEAIYACKVEAPATAERIPAPAIDIALPRDPEPAVSSRPVPHPWYANHVADALAVGGIATTVVAAVVYRGALADRAAADRATSYGAFADQIDRAHTERTTAMVLGAAGVASIAAGAIYFMLADRAATDHGIQIAPGDGGGVASWSGRW